MLHTSILSLGENWLSVIDAIKCNALMILSLEIKSPEFIAYERFMKFYVFLDVF